MTTVRPSETQAKQSRGRKSGNYLFLSQWVDVGFFVGGWEFTLEITFWDAVNRGREEMASQMAFFLVIQCTGGSAGGGFLGVLQDPMPEQPGRVCKLTRTLVPKALHAGPFLVPSQWFPRGPAGE